MSVFEAREPYSYRDDPAVPLFADERPIVVFDGLCVLCSTTARFLIRHDPSKRLRLLAAQTPLGRALYAHYGLNPDIYDTFIVIAKGRASFRSTAALTIAGYLGPPWSFATIARLVPPALRDVVYNCIASNRFRLFGRHATCFLPTTGDADRFLA